MTLTITKNHFSPTTTPLFFSSNSSSTDSFTGLQNPAQEIASEMDNRIYNIGYGIGRGLNMLYNGVKKYFWKDSSSDARELSSDSPNRTASLTTYVGDGHGMVILSCQSCGDKGEPISQGFSFYPHVMTKQFDCVQEEVEDKIPFVLRSVFVGMPGTAFNEDPRCLGYRTASKEYPITESTAKSVYRFVNDPHRYHFLGIFGYNCMDFVQKTAENAGLNKHFSQDLHIPMRPGFWGTIPTAYLYLYRLTYPIHPIQLILGIGCGYLAKRYFF